MISAEYLEKARLKLQDHLDAAKTRTDRNRLGQFATPPELASAIVTYALSLLRPRSKIRYLEPGLGTGAFYSALLSHVPSSRIQAAVGYEIDPHYAEAAKRLWRGTGLRLRVSDFAKTRPPNSETAKYNLVVCNPPYVRHHHLGRIQKRELQAAVARYLNFEMSGLSGLYAYFMILSQAWMPSGGVGAWLVPSEFMDVNYGRKVKNFLTEKVTLHRIHRFDPSEVQFENALVSSAIVIFSNLPPSHLQQVEFTFGGTLIDPKIVNSIGLEDLRHIPKWTALPRNASRHAQRPASGTLADLFTIKRGLATGCNSFFILTPEQAEHLKLPKEFLRPILPSPRELDTDEILANEDGAPTIENRRYLLACNLRESEVKSRYPALWQYFEHGIKEGVHKRYLSSHRQPWYSQENRPPAPFLCTYMGRPTKRNNSPFRFILNHSTATAPNVYLMLYPKPTLATLLRDEPRLLRTVWRALSSIPAETLTAEGRVYGGGLHKLEPNELANVAADAVLNAFPANTDAVLQRQLELFAS